MKFAELQTIINGTEIDKAVRILSSQKKDVDIVKLKKQWNVDDHDVLDKTIRKDRDVAYEEKLDVGGETRIEVKKKIESVARIPVPFQKNIVGKAVSFLFGNPVKITSSAEAETEISVLNSITKILDDNKTDSQNRVVAKQLFRSTQVAEFWYPVKSDETHEEYGFPTPFKLKMSVFSPWSGVELFPFFDDFGDMIAFSRRYVLKDEDDKDVTNFETYTSETYYLWKQAGETWEQVEKTANVIKRIPVVYADQEQAEWADVQYAIERLETLISNHADTNDYNGSPIAVAEGEIISLGQKGERGKVIEMEKGGKLSYLSWDHAPESIKMEIETLFKIILTYTQTPDISFESVKGIGAISGIALKLLFMDAHLKVMDKREIFDPYLKRRLNIIKAFVGMMNTSVSTTAKKLKVDAEITPYIIEDDLERLRVLTEANGGKAVMSQRTSVAQSGFVDDPEAEYDQLQIEFEKAFMTAITEPTE
ncbi:phage portal protein [Dyadobacter chenhuakuii]|uniref:Phage portal protein n=1 Tax=Dyadobacter chenhuakuii TaxID=2909339 RepID=A0A9X1QBG9_9BACT|nr:phage portal protein [Dyadobacter chenhuakuii]MCF2498380.1 phage portal protein [Dyadobacter chenhuakuii]